MALPCDAQLHLVPAYGTAPAFVADASAVLGWVEASVAALREPFDELADAYGVLAPYRHFVQGAVAHPASLVKPMKGGG